MNKRTFLLITFLLGIIAFATIVALSLRRAMPHSPLEGHDQLVLVISRTENTGSARIITYDRDGDSWRIHGAGAAVIGENGMAWGRGLNQERDIGGEAVKRDGDGRTPKGAFELLGAYGTLPPSSVNIVFPYMQIMPELVCINDARSEFYNQVVNSGTIGSNPANPPSHVDLFRDDIRFKYLIQIGHNITDMDPGAGSCIFLHLWRDDDTPTGGCTAVSEATMLEILGWLDSVKKPVIVQLTRRSYRRLKDVWGLPDVTI